MTMPKSTDWNYNEGYSKGYEAGAQAAYHEYLKVKVVAGKLAEALAFSISCMRSGEAHGADHELVRSAIDAWKKLDPVLPEDLKEKS